jgi:putative tryptophan/tyrosine transport system substrate-binding protein
LEGRNIRIDHRFTAGSAGQFQRLARELIDLEPDVIVGHTTPLAVALRLESRAIPIVFVNVSNPMEAGLVANLARPGGNVTGVLHYEPGSSASGLGCSRRLRPV